VFALFASALQDEPTDVAGTREAHEGTTGPRPTGSQVTTWSEEAGVSRPDGSPVEVVTPAQRQESIEHREMLRLA
jgi:hypothetical protein